MPTRHAPAIALSLTISLSLLAGCGPKADPATGQRAAPTVEIPVLPTGGGVVQKGPEVQPARKTFTREEVTKWLKSSPGNGGWKPEAVKAKFGAPDATSEHKMPGVRSSQPHLNYDQIATVWEYRGLTVDAAGSEKVDSVTRLVFTSGTTAYHLTEFIP